MILYSFSKEDLAWCNVIIVGSIALYFFASACVVGCRRYGIKKRSTLRSRTFFMYATNILFYDFDSCSAVKNVVELVERIGVGICRELIGIYTILNKHIVKRFCTSLTQFCVESV